jgi:hypothetical protein
LYYVSEVYEEGDVVKFEIYPRRSIDTHYSAYTIASGMYGSIAAGSGRRPV